MVRHLAYILAYHYIKDLVMGNAGKEKRDKGTEIMESKCRVQRANDFREESRNRIKNRRMREEEKRIRKQNFWKQDHRAEW